MVRNQIFRRRKYANKVDGAVSELRLDAYGAEMQTSHAAMQLILVAAEEAAKTQILEPNGVPVNEIPHYLNAKREFCRLARNFTSLTLLDEAINTLERFVARGFQNNLLVQLAAQCGIDLWAYYEYP